MTGRAAAAILFLTTITAPTYAAQVDIIGPVGSRAFGSSVTVLPNGNIVVTDPEAGATRTGAVYLYAPDQRLISRLSGSSPDDRIGSSGIVVLENGNFVVGSPYWDNADARDAGAATWIDGRTGLSGMVSAGNSLVGTTDDDRVGLDGSIIVLVNGNYVVASSQWSDGVTHDNGDGSFGAGSFGAVTWGSGVHGVAGAISAANSLVGTTRYDHVGEKVTALANGHYVVASPYWGNGVENREVGAVTWANGATGLRGPVSTANSLTGSMANDRVGANGITALDNGHYVVASQFWNGSAGAVTWGDGTRGTTGSVSPDNSLVGTTHGDYVGDEVTALANGNYVVASKRWNDGVPYSHVGAVTWGNGASGTVGAVSSANSLVRMDYAAVTPLANGNYVVSSPNWIDTAADGTRLKGAATWVDGTRGATGFISASDSLVGTADGGRVGIGGVVALANGHYVVVSSIGWNVAIGGPEADAATWGDGNHGTTGYVSPGNSLYGKFVRLVALDNGNYVAIGHVKDSVEDSLRLAMTWGDGGSGTTGHVSADNSRIGLIGGGNSYVGEVTPLSNGHYVICNYWWSGDIRARDFGAVTWGNGAAASTGTISARNSLVGANAGDLLCSAGVTALRDGRYVVTTYPNTSPLRPGGVTLVDGRSAVSATMESSATVFGGSVHSYDATRQRLAVGRPQDNTVTLLTLPAHASTGNHRRPAPPSLLHPRERR